MSEITDFYSGQGCDYEGRTLAVIWGYDDDLLEDRHDYIQILFPLPEPSPFNRAAAVLTEEDKKAFAVDATLKANLIKSFRCMLHFYGFEEKDGAIVKGENYVTAATRNWLIPHNPGSRYNHNYLRITRILRCLSLCGLGGETQKFMDALEHVYIENADNISRQSLLFWRQALATPYVSAPPALAPR